MKLFDYKSSRVASNAQDEYFSRAPTLLLLSGKYNLTFLTPQGGWGKNSAQGKEFKKIKEKKKKRENKEKKKRKKEKKREKREKKRKKKKREKKEKNEKVEKKGKKK